MPEPAGLRVRRLHGAAEDHRWVGQHGKRTAPGTSGARITTSGTGTGGTAGSTTSGGTTTGGVSATTTGGIGATTGGGVPGTSTGGGVAATTTGGIVPACPDPSIAGDWTMNSTYEIAQGLSNGYPGLLGAINEVANFLNTWSYAFLVPPWVSLIFNDLTGFDVLFQNLNVVSDMELAPFASNPWSYTSTETWEQVTVMFHGTPLAVPPQASYDSPNPYEVDTCTGTTTFQDHDLSGAVTGLIPPLLDAIVQADCEFQGCPYSTFAQLMNGILEDVIPCSELDDGSLLGSLGATACAAAEQAVSNDIEAAIGLIPIDIGVASDAGHGADQPRRSGRHLGRQPVGDAVPRHARRDCQLSPIHETCGQSSVRCSSGRLRLPAPNRSSWRTARPASRWPTRRRPTSRCRRPASTPPPRPAGAGRSQARATWLRFWHGLREEAGGNGALTGTASATASAGSGTGPSGGLTTTSTAGGASSAEPLDDGDPLPARPAPAQADESGGVSTGGGARAAA